MPFEGASFLDLTYDHGVPEHLLVFSTLIEVTHTEPAINHLKCVAQ